MRVAIVYDCLYPNTVGGAERWYRELAERLSEHHRVTYLTRAQWGDEGPGTSFETLAVSSGGPLYTESGRRRIGSPLRFGAGIFWHLLRHPSRYEVVHCCSFPYFSLLGAWLALRVHSLLGRGRGGGEVKLVVDWFEVWTRDYWIGYLGRLGGRIGHAVQRLCARLPDQSFVFSRVHARRLEQEGHRAAIVRLTGLYAGEPRQSADRTLHATTDLEAAAPRVIFAGRHIPEKRVTLIPDVIAAAREHLPSLGCTIYGDGPESGELAERVRALGLTGIIETPGRVAASEVERALARADCMLLTSSREGYGLVAVEAIARGTPVVVVAGADNAATELVEAGVNGFIAPSADPAVIAACVIEAVEQGGELRRSTLAWYRAHREELSIQHSLAAVQAAYESRREPIPSVASSRGGST